jgi:hypothetical protein
VVIDLANSPSFEDKAVLEFFQTESKSPMSTATDAALNCQRIKQRVQLRPRTPWRGLPTGDIISSAYVASAQASMFAKVANRNWVIP